MCWFNEIICLLWPSMHLFYKLSIILIVSGMLYDIIHQHVLSLLAENRTFKPNIWTVYPWCVWFYR